jgi:two-component system response regulator AtoC
MALRRVLVVDDEESMRHILTHLLSSAGFDVRAAPDGAAALLEVETSEPDVVLTDINMPGVSGMDLLVRLREKSPDVLVIMMSAYGTIDVAIEAMKAGAYDYVSKPFRPDEVLLVLRKAEERERLVRENRRLRAGRTLPAEDLAAPGLVGRSASLTAAVKMASRIAKVKTTVLLLGESGTGKELFARLLHESSPRAEAPFVAVNCGAIPEQLIESELFGHAKGAFTDAVRAHKGLFEEADGGTLFLDEIGELPIGMQVKLLRVLEEEEIRRVGDARSVKIDVRVIAATMRDLPADVQSGRFREDLYHRINVFQLRLPALRDRKDDIPILARHFLAQHSKRLGIEARDFTDEAMVVLESHPWPGNVRELENIVERALVLSDSSMIGTESLPDRLLTPVPVESSAPAPEAGDLSLKRASRSLEEDFIRRALARTKGNRTRAAELLELSHRAMLYKMKEFGIT